MRMLALAIGVVALTALGCARQPANEGEQQPELSAELKSLVLNESPSDIPNPLYLDFDGHAELLGYALEPARLAPPGSKLSLKLFWRSTGRLPEGYRIYTQLVTPGGKRFDVQGSGPVRQGALGPSTWEPGKVYIDELDVTVPDEVEASRFSLVVGLMTEPSKPEEPEQAEAAEPKKDAQKAEKAGDGTFGAVYLPVLSGPADSKHGGVIATLETGVTPGAKRARTAKDEKRAAGAASKRLGLPGRIPASAKPRDPSARPALAQPAP